VALGHLRVEDEGIVDTVAHVEAPNASSVMAMAEARKPIRIDRGSASQPKKSEMKRDSTGEGMVLRCGLTLKVHSGSSKNDRCPDSCPFFVQDRTDKDFCTFSCVMEQDCAKLHPGKQIGDRELGVCRSCIVDGCETCDESVLEDRCLKCQAGFLLKDGKCDFKYNGPWMNWVGGFLVVLLVLVVIWILDMQFRPCWNADALEASLANREQCKLRMKKDEEGERKPWPLTTNLLTTLVAGPGMILHFNFQAALIVWALFVGATWMCFAEFVDNDLWLLGTRRFGTPRNNCILVAWGYETQKALMWTKIAFLEIVYFGTVIMCFFYSVAQLRRFQETDYMNKTMKDFVAMIVGLPALSGDKPVEEDLREALERVTGQNIVGVSVAWDYQEVEEEVAEALKADLAALVTEPEPQEPPPMNPIRRAFYNFEKTILGLEPEDTTPARTASEVEAQDSAPALAGSTKDLLCKIHTSPRAFVVFDTQQAMEEAVEKVQHTNGFPFMGGEAIMLEPLDAEPDTVQWQNFGHSSPKEKTLKLAAGFGIIGLACLFWAVVFYAPYAYYVMTFNYENGRQPGFIVGFAFSMIVVIGNAIMYEVCARISDWVGFRFKDNREACYMILYTVACMFNVALDFVTTYYTAEKVMEGLGFRNYFGKPLEDITEFTEKFETYGMQRSLAENTYAYAFPSTFLIPFLIEPFPTIIMPLWLGRLIVRSHTEVQGIAADEWLGMADMEMGRYADLLLNVILGILIFYFPGGYTWMLFLGMAASHVWIYVFDHYRVLRSIPSCTFASYDVEWWAQAMLAPIVGIIASCWMFKTNCTDGFHCFRGPSLIFACCLAWTAHVVMHLLVLVVIVPKLGKPAPEEDPSAVETFQSLSTKLPCSWFTANPIHCLRSKHFYNHQPPCAQYVLGKEFVMKPNSTIGCFFEESMMGCQSPKHG